jgi:single-strand DNA-binding protein
MANLNRVLLIGNLTREVDLRYTPKGTPVAEITLAINRVSKSEDGTKREEVTFVDVTLWSRQAELAQQYLRKGNPVFIEDNSTPGNTTAKNIPVCGSSVRISNS